MRFVLLVTVGAGCSAPDGSAVREAATEGESDPAGDSATGDSATGDTATGDPGCPLEMAAVGGFCIDRWEAGIAGWSPYEVPSGGVAVSAEGQVPQGYIDADVAAAGCAAAGKRLCTSTEWVEACSGGTRTYPYGDTYDPEACNTEYAGDHPVCDYFGTCDGVWDTAHMNDPGINQQPGTETAAGAYARCVTPEGVADLHGNLHEWVADAEGTFRGGFYADASINGAGCGYVTSAHDRAYHDYSTGFRCCGDLR